MSYVSDLLSVLTPKPSPVPLVRMGGDGDGAYLVPDDIDGVKACFSPGVNNRKTFEDEMARQHGIHCYMCDFSSDVDQLSTPLIPGLQVFDKKWLDIDGGQDSISLQQWVDLYAPDVSQDLLLQIDIEGAEYRNLNSTSEALMRRFRIIIMELHDIATLLDPRQAEVDLAPLLRKLDQTHVCVHIHPNNCCGEVIDPESGRNIPTVAELTLLRRDRFGLRRDPALSTPPCLPHPLDVSCNMPDRPPLHMNQNWLGRAPADLDSQSQKLGHYGDYVSYLWENNKTELANNVLVYEGALQASLRNLYRLASDSRAVSEETVVDWSDGGAKNIAQGKKFMLSDSYPGFPKVGFVRDQEPMFFHTALAMGQFITVDLVYSEKLAWLVLKNRADGLGERARYLFYAVHDEITFNPDSVLPVLMQADFFYSPNSLSVTPLLGQVGRYLTLYSPAFSAIHLSSLRLYSCRNQ